jgi:hypothetical protein
MRPAAKCPTSWRRWTRSADLSRHHQERSVADGGTPCRRTQLAGVTASLGSRLCALPRVTWVSASGRASKKASTLLVPGCGLWADCREVGAEQNVVGLHEVLQRDQVRFESRQSGLVVEGAEVGDDLLSGLSSQPRWKAPITTLDNFSSPIERLLTEHRVHRRAARRANGSALAFGRKGNI